MLGCFTAKATVETIAADILFYVVPQRKVLLGLDTTHLLKLIFLEEHLSCGPEVAVPQSGVATTSASCATLDVKPGSRENEKSFLNTVKDSIEEQDKRNSNQKSNPYTNAANITRGDKRNTETPYLNRKKQR